jgi:DNA ligase-1
MSEFVRLVSALDQTTKTNEKLGALRYFFDRAANGEAIHAIALLSGKRPKRTINTRQLRECLIEATAFPEWLVEETWHVVGDLAEALAKSLPPANTQASFDLVSFQEDLKALNQADEITKKRYVIDQWAKLDNHSRFVFNKLITGHFRLGVSRNLITKSLSDVYHIPKEVVAHKLMGDWNPFDHHLIELLFNENTDAISGKPYPFYLANPLENGPENLPDVPDAWQAEWKWDGIRGQLILRDDAWYLWSRGEELISQQFPEFESIRKALPNGLVLDGEILIVKDGMVMPFQQLQTRITRKKVSQSLMEKSPAQFRAYDLLEYEGTDNRHKPLSERRVLLETLIENLQLPSLALSSKIVFKSWGELTAVRETSREHMAEGIMVKSLSGAYQSGRKRGGWWKWKVDPMTIDAVMIYAMRGHGRRANLYTDYTFAVWDDSGNLIPIAKAYSGLTDAEIREVDRFVKQNTVERFGPVRSVVPNLVFELAFEGIQKSGRHKSGVALRFTRIFRWRKDKSPEEANNIADLQKLIVT